MDARTAKRVAQVEHIKQKRYYRQTPDEPDPLLGVSTRVQETARSQTDAFMAAVVSFLSLLDEKRAEAEQECDDLAAQCNKWLAETRQQTEQQMLYRT